MLHRTIVTSSPFFPWYLHSVSCYFQQMDEGRCFHQSRFLPFQCVFLDIFLSFYLYFWLLKLFPGNPGKYTLFSLLIPLPFLFMQDCSYLQFFFRLYINDHVQAPFFSSWNYAPTLFMKSRFFCAWTQYK